MSLEEGLLKVLNDHDEPLPKRLKIADNAFKLSQVKIPHCELFLLKWLAQVEISHNSLECWEQCHSWLSADRFRGLRSSNIPSDHIEAFLQRVEEQFQCEDEKILDTLVLVVISLIESPIFEHYFRTHLNEYLSFLKNSFENCGNCEILLKLLARHDKIFGRRIVNIANFHEVFVEKLFSSFINILIKFSLLESQLLFETLSSIVQKNVFLRRQDDFMNVFAKLWISDENAEDNMEILSLLLQKLPVTKKGNSTYAYHSHRLLYHAFSNCYKQNPTLCYNLFAYILQNLGFSSINLKISPNASAQLDSALSGLVAMLDVILAANLKFEEQINGLSFSDLLQNILVCMIQTTKAPISVRCYQIVDLIIEISPMTIESNVSQLLIYLICAKNEPFATQYSATMCNVFKVFSKLHRIPNLISKMIRNLQPVYLDENMSKHSGSIMREDFRFVGKISKSLKEEIALGDNYVELDVNKILPPDVLEVFCAGAVTMATKQVSNLFKTFTFHLDELIAQDLAEKSKSSSFVTFIEILNLLMCHYLEKINMAGSFRTANVTEKITKNMDETQSVLEKFGNALVGIEHNQNLMRVFLHLSYTWGELKILVQHALINDNQSTIEVKDVELSSCNIAFLHSYLSSQTWCLIAERISNFGEQPCKKIMEKLWIQKIRFLILSGMDYPAVNEHISALIKAITPIEEYYEYLLTNEFASYVILQHMDSKSLITIAECVLKDATKNPAILNRVIESRHFVSALVYSILRKLNKTFKKEAKTLGCEFISCTVFSHVGENFIEHEVDVKELNVNEVFANALGALEKFKAANRNAINLNLDKFKGYFALIKQLPIVYFEKSIQTLLFYYLLGVLLDVKGEKQNGDVENDLEILLLGLAQTKILSLDAILPTNAMVKTVITKFNNSQEMFSLLLSNHPTDGVSLGKALDYLKKNLGDDKHIKCLLLLTKYLNKHKKNPEVMKTLQTNLSQLGESLLSFVSGSKSENSSIYLELLIECLKSDNCSITDNIVTELDKKLEMIFREKEGISQGELALFNFAFTNETFKRLSMEANDKATMFISNLANTLGYVKLEKDLVHVYATNVVIVLQNIENMEEYNLFLDHILERVITSIDAPEGFALEMQVWHQILSATMKSEKAESLKNAVEKLLISLFKKVQSLEGNNAGDDHQKNLHEQVLIALMDFEIHLLQNTQHLLTWRSIDICFASITHRILREPNNMEASYRHSIEMLEVMLKHRQPLIHDRISVFLQEYRFILRALTADSDTSNRLHSDQHFDKMAELAHLLEKLTINLCKLQAHMASIAIYLIADFVTEYETITIYPAVKLALNNCVYNLIALCSQHSIACLMRMLSPGAAAIFKVTYDDYKKYHRFTGKV